MPNNRQRYERPRSVVPTVAQIPTNTGSAAIDSILSSVGSTPLNPNAVDVNSILQTVLNPAPAQAMPEPGLLDTILSSIGEAVGVATSNDPSMALRQNMQQRQQIKLAEQQYQRERADRIADINRQFGLNVLNRQLEEQAAIRAEERDDTRFEKRRKSALDDYIQKQGIDYQYDEKRSKLQNEAAKSLAVLQHQWDLEKQAKADDRFDRTQSRLENKDLFDKKISLLTAGIPAGLANSIANKMYNGEELTDKEAKTITAAAQRSMRLAAGGGRGSGVSSGSQLTDKQKFQYLNTRMKDQFVVVEIPVTDAQGKPVIDPNTKLPVTNEVVVEMSNAPKDITGQIAGFKRIASDGEKMQKLSAEIEAIDAIRGNKPSVKNTAVLPTKLSFDAMWDGRVRQMKKDGLSDAEIISGVKEFLNNPNVTEEEKDAVNSAIINAGVLKGRQFVPKGTVKKESTSPVPRWFKQ